MTTNVWEHKLNKYQHKRKKLSNSGGNLDISYTNPMPVVIHPKDYVNTAFRIPNIIYGDKMLISNVKGMYVLQKCTLLDQTVDNEDVHLWHGTIGDTFDFEAKGGTFFAFDPIDSVNIVCEKFLRTNVRKENNVFKFKLGSQVTDLAIITDSIVNVLGIIAHKLDASKMSESQQEKELAKILTRPPYLCKGWLRSTTGWIHTGVRGNMDLVHKPTIELYMFGDLRDMDLILVNSSRPQVTWRTTHIVQPKLEFVMPDAPTKHELEGQYKTLVKGYVKYNKLIEPCGACVGLFRSSMYRICTYNVHYMTNYSEIVAVIHSVNADILILQEYVHNAEFHNRMRAMYPWFSLGYTEILEGDVLYGNIVYSKYEIGGGGGTYILPYLKGDESDLRDHKIFYDSLETYFDALSRFIGVNFGAESSSGLDQVRSVIHVPIMVDGNVVNILATHLDVFDPSGVVRELQIRSVDRFVGILGLTNVFLCGDLNLINVNNYGPDQMARIRRNDELRLKRVPYYGEYELLEKLGYKDSFEMQNVPAKNKSFTLAPALSVWSLRRVDYVLGKLCDAVKIDRAYVYYSVASDHLPIIVDFGVKMGVADEQKD